MSREDQFWKELGMKRRTVYMLRDKTTGLYVGAGFLPDRELRFARVFSRLNAVKNSNPLSRNQNLEIVEYELSEARILPVV